jgi:polysaccharide deacetylase family protein (PEP-CTERM system associated)
VKKLNLLGIDFEDWYHPELIKKYHKQDYFEPLIVNGIDKIIDWLQKNDTYATFFVVGELLEFKPELLDKIIENGHEIGFHTMYHNRLDETNYKEIFSDELKKFSELTNKKSKGFRAPSFSLSSNTSWAIDILESHGYLYDTSIVPAKTRLYGVENAQNTPYLTSSKSIEKHDNSGKLVEFPLLTTNFLSKQIPAGGGFYLRSLPLGIIRNAITQINKINQPATFYIHSWELVPELMPKISLPFIDNFITFYNIKKALDKMTKLIQEFQFTSFERYISDNNYNLNKFNKPKEFH